MITQYSQPVWIAKRDLAPSLQLDEGRLAGFKRKEEVGPLILELPQESIHLDQ